jgi:hypothetical protein
MRSGFGLSRHADQPLSVNAWCRLAGMFSKFGSLPGEALLKRFRLLEVIAQQLHGVPLSMRGRRERVMALSSPIRAKGWAVMK